MELTLIASLSWSRSTRIFGTIIAWVLVRDEFPGKRYVNAIIDLPFALPTIVAGLTLLALYGEHTGSWESAACRARRSAMIMALLFVTLPFVVRAVQPVLIELDQDMEEAAASLGASRSRSSAGSCCPNLTPAMFAGVALAFARAIGEFGSLILISGNMPFKTEVASVFIFKQVEAGNEAAAASVSVVLLAISVAVLFFINWFGRRAAKG